MQIGRMLKSGFSALAAVTLFCAGAMQLAGQSTTNQDHNEGFFTRLGHAYINDWTASSNGLPPAPEPQRRGTPAPLNSPPFPSADWPIGGTPVIGAPDYQTYMLMQAINKNETRFKVYGWFSIGYNAGTSNKGKYANAPLAYDVIPNSIQLDQAALYFERLPDTVQKEHFGRGFQPATASEEQYLWVRSGDVLHGFLFAAHRTRHRYPSRPLYISARY